MKTWRLDNDLRIKIWDIVFAILLSCAMESVKIAVEWLRQGCSKGTCSPVLSCDSDCVLQVIVGKSYRNCYIIDAI